MARTNETNQADREQRTTELMAQLEAGVTAIQTSDDFKRYLSVAAKFHAYSHNNVLLIIAQRPEATRVAGYRTWQSLGRQVNKGERAIYIFAPRPYRVEQANAQSEEESNLRVAFRAVPVFDISQTEGDDIPTIEAPLLTGGEGAHTYARLVTFAESLGLSVTNHDPLTCGDDTRSAYNGYYSPTNARIFVKHAAPAQMVKTLIHELGHHLDPELELAPRGERETVAEATAFIVAAQQGIDTASYSFPYIAFWAGKDDGAAAIKTVMARVQQIAHRIIAGILEHEAMPEAAALQAGPRLAA